MEIKKSYITDESGTIKNVVIDLNTFIKKTYFGIKGLQSLRNR